MASVKLQHGQRRGISSPDTTPWRNLMVAVLAVALVVIFAHPAGCAFDWVAFGPSAQPLANALLEPHPGEPAAGVEFRSLRPYSLRGLQLEGARVWLLGGRLKMAVSFLALDPYREVLVRLRCSLLRQSGLALDVGADAFQAGTEGSLRAALAGNIRVAATPSMLGGLRLEAWLTGLGPRQVGSPEPICATALGMPLGSSARLDLLYQVVRGFSPEPLVRCSIFAGTLGLWFGCRPRTGEVGFSLGASMAPLSLRALQMWHPMLGVTHGFSVSLGGVRDGR